MKPWNDKKWIGLSLITVFLLFIFIWGTMSLGRATSQSTQPEKQPEPKVTASGASVDIGELTNRLLTEVDYEATLEIMDSALAGGMVDIADDSVMELYMGEGTSADELLIIQSASESDAKKDQSAVEKHLKEMKKSFENYLPEQADKVGQAVIVRCGCYVLACVSSDAEHAQDMIVEAFQQ
ncbi:MAG: DUF4358 domain-containing protein [Lachnospiraceae bacterium]|nr:DUF4358 domain-containing protein [Lachnospiraceae bacterium]